MPNQKDKNYKNMIEALLFASGRYMSIETLMNLTKAENKEIIIEIINQLKGEYDSRESPLMIVEEKDGFKLTVREQYLPLVRKIVSETELPKTILETLAVIAWKNPAKQSEIIQIRHNKAYDHIEELEELGFIKKEKKGRSFILKLTDKFYDYFDIDGVKDIKDVFKRVVDKNIQKYEISQLNKQDNLIQTNQQTLQESVNEKLNEKTEESEQKENKTEKNEIIKEEEKKDIDKKQEFSELE
ncbi:MAG: SMC-Scp complex subunit ScpB [Candidatus Woesearchaeota archaeon]